MASLQSLSPQPLTYPQVTLGSLSPGTSRHLLGPAPSSSVSAPASVHFKRIAVFRTAGRSTNKAASCRSQAAVAASSSGGSSADVASSWARNLPGLGSQQPWRRKSSSPAVKLPSVLSPRAATLLRIVLRHNRTKEELWQALESASACKGGSEDVTSVLAELRRQKHWPKALEVYEWLLLTPGLFRPDVRTYNLILEAYASSRQPGKCEAVFRAMQESGDAVRLAVASWNSRDDAEESGEEGAISEETEGAIPEDSSASEGAKEEWRDRNNGCIPSEASWSLLISALCQAGEIRAAEGVFVEMQRKGYKPSLLTFNSMLEVYGRAKDVSAAEKLFARIQKEGYVVPTVNTHNIMIAAYARAGMADKAESLFRGMHRTGLVPDKATFTAVLSAFAEAEVAEGAERVFKGMLRMGHVADLDACNLLLAAHRCDAEGALKCFKDLSSVYGCTPDEASHELVAEALALGGDWAGFEEFLESVPSDSLRQNPKMQLWRLQAFAEAGEIEGLELALGELQDQEGEGLNPKPLEKEISLVRLLALGQAGQLEQMFEFLEGVQSPDGRVGIEYMNVLLQALGRQGMVDKAEDLFASLETVTGSTPDEGSYVALMAAYAERKNARKCMSLCRKMVGEGIRAGVEVRRAVLKACRSEAQEQEVHQLFSSLDQRVGSV